MTVKCSISLTDEQHSFAKELVEAGRYATVSAVLHQWVDKGEHRLSTRPASTNLTPPRN